MNPEAVPSVGDAGSHWFATGSKISANCPLEMERDWNKS